MSDFIDRLAARAIEREAVVAPRLPSLFEPPQRAPIMSPVEGDEISVRRPDAVSEIPVIPTATVAPSARVIEAAQRSAARVTPVDRALAPAPAAAAPLRDLAQPSSPSRTPVHQPAVEHAAPSSSPTRPPTVNPWPTVPPRQTRMAADRPGPIPPQPVGSLLPASTPVFAMPRAVAAPAHAGRAAAMRAHNAPADSGSPSGSEPVVHVSIGRLEVRAAPVAAAPPRRRDGAQPSSLDDYLRQRGGKVSP